MTISIDPGTEGAVPRVFREKSSQSGFAYLMALFLVMVVIIGSQVAMQNLLTQGRRERESEMVWRGNQYARAIRLYYKKTGHYPQNIEELEKGVLNLHFLRLAAYKDPMNRDDGAWRFIYVNQTGQIIGSVRYATLQQMALMEMNGGKLPTGQLGALPGVPAANAGNGGANSTSPPNATATAGSPSGNTASGAAQNSGANQPAGQSTPLGTAPAAAGQDSMGGQGVNPLALLKPTGPVDGPVLGGLLTGVGSKVDKASVRVYNGGKKYNEWEFIWNPLEDQARAMQQGPSPIGAPFPGQSGAQPGQGTGLGGIGSLFGNPGGGSPAPQSPGTQGPAPGSPAP